MDDIPDNILKLLQAWLADHKATVAARTADIAADAALVTAQANKTKTAADVVDKARAEAEALADLKAAEDALAASDGQIAGIGVVIDQPNP